MGVNGLWTVVQPCARPTNLATLNRKRLAVDASIWIYQFLKAVRDKEGNALRNSHVVGFFRRICKLLWFGIQPVFVFDGGAPALKRQTILGRKQRREGRRDDAVRTAGKLLAVQMQRIAEEEQSTRRRDAERGIRRGDREEPAEVIPDADTLVYVDEVGMSQQERQRTRKFYKQDAYHLPELEGGLASNARADDPRIMSVEELEEYARQFHNGEDINLYDFSKIDFHGEFFRSLPPPDRYYILNAARLRSRLRMGLSKEQLEDMFPDRMAFSKFQIERVQERNNLTQLLMKEAGMTGLDLTVNGAGRIAGEKDREYILVKNDGVEGGWALGVVSKERDVGEAHKPIDVDALEFRYEQKDELDDWEEEEDFEDVPVEGLNRLPKLHHGQRVKNGLQAADDAVDEEQEDSLFVGGEVFRAPEMPTEESLHPEEEDDISRAIALSLQNQHGVGLEADDLGDVFEDVDMPAPTWTQKAAVAEPKPIASTSGRMVAHIVNNRSNAAVPQRRESNGSSSDSDMDLQAALAASRRQKKIQPKPAVANIKNPFDGPLPFPKLDWGSSLFAKKAPEPKRAERTKAQQEDGFEIEDEEEDLAGGFERELQDNAPRPLPPWMVDTSDIRESLKKQQEIEQEINTEDREMAQEEERVFRRQHEEALIEIQSSDDDSDVEVVEAPPAPKAKTPEPVGVAAPDNGADSNEDADLDAAELLAQSGDASPDAEPDFEDVQMPDADDGMEITVTELPDSPAPEIHAVSPRSQAEHTPEITFEDIQGPDHLTVRDLEGAAGSAEDNPFPDSDGDEYSDPEDEELFANLAQEAEEHARFASELNNKSESENKEAYERELKALRSQQKKDRRDADEVTQVMVSECQALLRLFGIPYITAPMEAEAQCAELVHLGLVDGIVTDDSDIFLFGGTRVYKNMFNSNKFVECYLGADLEKELSLSRVQLIAIAQLLGSDYTEGLPGVGPVTAVEILSEFPGQDGLRDFRDWWADVQRHSRPKEADVSSSFRRKFRKSQATKLFLPAGFPSQAVTDAYLHPEVDNSSEQFKWGVPDLEGLRQFLMATIGWSQERTDEVLVPVIKDMNKREIEGTQANITRYFQGAVGVGAKEAFAPRQKAKGSKRMAEAVNKLRANAGSDLLPSMSTPASSKRRRTANRRAVAEEDDAADETG